jgi:hypothetical protein
MINRKFFFDTVRLRLFGGALKASQVQGLTALLDVWENEHSGKDDRWLAYALATGHHETDRKMQPIHEYGTESYFRRRYDINGQNPALARRLGNIHPGDGAKFHGRGYVQLTGRSNYTDWNTRLNNIGLVANPDLALDPDISAKILFTGMELGTFTSKKFSDYFNARREDWVNARRIINGQDKAQLISSYGHAYYSALSYTT